MKKTELSNPEFNVLVNGFEKELEKENKSENHIYENISYIKEMLSYFEMNGIHYIKDVNQMNVSDYILYLEQVRVNHRSGYTLENTTINKHMISIRKFWKYLDAEGIKTQPIKLTQKKVLHNNVETITLTEHEVQLLYAVCDESALGYRDKAMLAIYYGCGMRKSEGLNLLITDIDFSRERIHVRKSKNNRERYVMMSPTITKQLEEYVYNYRDFYLEENSPCLNLFISERGNLVSKSTLAKRLETLCNRVKEQYGVDKQIGLHGLRHSIGTHLYMRKFDIKMIALMLGHVTLESTKHYIHSANLLKQ